MMQVFPVLLATLLAGDPGAVVHMTRLVGQLRQHLRPWLHNIINVVHLLWPPPPPAGTAPSPLLGDLLDLIACLSGELQHAHVTLGDVCCMGS